MSESQFIRRIEPQIKKSTLDGHQILTAQPKPTATQQATQAHPPTHKATPRAPATRPATHASSDVVIKSAQPIDARMQPGGVVVKHPPGARQVTPPIAVRRPAQITDPTTKILGERVLLSDAQRAYLRSLVENDLSTAGGARLATATATLDALGK